MPTSHEEGHICNDIMHEAKFTIKTCSLFIVLQLLTKSVQDSVDNLHVLNKGLPLYRSKPHNIYTHRDHVYCIFCINIPEHSK